MNDWQPIDTMPLNAINTRIDVLDGKRLHTNITVDRISTGRWSIIEEVWPDRPDHLRDIDQFVLYLGTLEHGDLILEREDKWRTA